MATTLQDPRVAETLDRMYNESREQMSLLRERRPNMSAARTVQERADAMSEFLAPTPYTAWTDELSRVEQQLEQA